MSAGYRKAWSAVTCTLMKKPEEGAADEAKAMFSERVSSRVVSLVITLIWVSTLLSAATQALASSSSDEAVDEEEEELAARSGQSRRHMCLCLAALFRRARIFTITPYTTRSVSSTQVSSTMSRAHTPVVALRVAYKFLAACPCGSPQLSIV